MSFRRTLFAAIFFFICLSLYIADKAYVTKRKVANVINESLSHIPADKINEIFIKNEFGEFKLSRNKDSKWNIVSPFKMPADNDVINTILNNLNGAKKHNILETSNLEQYGLNKPKITLTIKGEGLDKIKEETILIGEDATYAGKVFAKIPGEKKIFTVTEHIKNNLSKNIDILRDRTIFSFESDNVEGITVENPKGKYTILHEAPLTEGGLASWKIAPPLDEAADPILAESLLQIIRTNKILAFIEKDVKPLSEYGLDAPSARVSLTTKTKSGSPESENPFDLIIGKKVEDQPRYYAKRAKDTSVIEIPEGLAKKLMDDVSSIRERKLFLFTFDTIASFKVTAGKSEAALVKNESGSWVFADDKNTKADEETIVKYLQNLRDLKIISFTDDNPQDLAKYGLESYLIKVEAKTKNGEIQSILTGHKDEEKKLIYVKKENRKNIYGVDWTELHNLLATKEDFFDKSLISFNESDIGKIRLLVGDRNYHVINKGSSFLCKTPDGKSFEIGTQDMNDFLSALKNLHYKFEIRGKVISDNDPGIESPKYLIEISSKNDQTIGILKIGNSYSSDCYVATADRLFGADKRMTDAFTAKIKNLLQLPAE